MLPYSSVDEMWLAALGALSAPGLLATESRNGPSTEVLGYSATLKDLDRTFLLNRTRNLNPTYAAAELLWYLSGEDDVGRIAPYAPSYYRFAEGSKAWGAYGRRWVADLSFLAESQESPYGQLYTAIELLLTKQTTRQCVVTCWNAGDLPHAVLGDKADLPCTLSWQFIRRLDKLHMVCTMRSEDVWLGYPYDVFVNTTIQRIVAGAVGASPGTYVHQVGCLHLYTPNQRSAVEAFMPASAADAQVRSSAHRHRDNLQTSRGWDTGTYRGHIATRVNACLVAERAAREDRSPMNDWYEQFAAEVIPSNPLHDAVLLCAAKWIPVHPNSLSSPLMREVYSANR